MNNQSESPDNNKNQSRAEAAVDVATQNRWLARVLVFAITKEPTRRTEDGVCGHTTTANDQGTQNNKNKERLELIAAGGASVAELKQRIATCLGISEKEQRIYCMKSGHPIFGQLPAIGAQETNIQLGLMEGAGWGAGAEALFEVIGLTQWEEQDEIMAGMIEGRPAWCCWNGHKLVTTAMASRNGGKNHRIHKQLCCYRCRYRDYQYFRRTGVAPYVCLECRFCLCSRCYWSDTGRNPVENPYIELPKTAYEVVCRLLGLVRCDAAATTFVDQIWQAKIHLDIDPESTKVLPDGSIAHFRHGRAVHSRCLPLGATRNSLGRFGTSEEFPRGATIRDIENHACRFASPCGRISVQFAGHNTKFLDANGRMMAVFLVDCNHS